MAGFDRGARAAVPEKLFLNRLTLPGSPPAPGCGPGAGPGSGSEPARGREVPLAVAGKTLVSRFPEFANRQGIW